MGKPNSQSNSRNDSRSWLEANQQVLNPTPLNPTPATCHKRKRKLRFGMLRCRSCTATLAFLQCGCHFDQKAALQCSKRKLQCDFEKTALQQSGAFLPLSCGFQAPTFRHIRLGPAEPTFSSNSRSVFFRNWGGPVPDTLVTAAEPVWKWEWISSAQTESCDAAVNLWGTTLRWIGPDHWETQSTDLIHSMDCCKHCFNAKTFVSVISTSSHHMSTLNKAGVSFLSALCQRDTGQWGIRLRQQAKGIHAKERKIPTSCKISP